jgi:hypothetical protein
MIKISFTADPLPSNFKGTLQDFQERFLLNLRGSIDGTSVLTGKIGGTKPTTNIGPWLNNGTWYVWNGAQYVPTTVKIGGPGYVVQLGSYSTTALTTTSPILATRKQLLQDKDGTIALLSDVYEGRPAIELAGTTPTIDWSAGHQFSEILTGNTTIKMINSLDGQRITVSLRNNATSYTVTWPATPAVFWTSGSPPVQTPNKTDLYVLRNIAGSIFGRQIANY